jgi:spermidine synthase
MRTLRAVVTLIGFTAVIAQIVLFREMIVVFYGNEISLGLMLGTWLLWTAAGSGLAGRFGAGIRNPRGLMAGLECVVALLFPATILAVRASRGVFQTVPGELLGPGPMLLTALVALSLFCGVSGWLFAVGVRLFAAETHCATGESAGAVYLLEAIGSGAGGILASLALIRYCSPFEIASLVGALNFLAAALLTRRAILAALIVLMLPLGRLETASLAHLWHGFRLVAVRNSVYGNLAVAATEGNRSLFVNGLRVFTVPDPAAAEQAVHFALLEHPSPTSLLLIGGGVNGSLAEALKHRSLARIDYVELDPAILDLFPVQAADLTRVCVHNLDGRLFLKTAQDRYDVIIVNLPDPETAQLNRYYTAEFFQEAARKLTPGGILSFSLRASEDYISPELAEFLRSIDKTLRSVFPEVVTIPGENVHFFASMRPGVLTANPDDLLARLKSRHLETSYVREYYIPFQMMPDRMRGLESQLRPRPETPVNRDFTPIAYYFDVTLWSTQFNRIYREVFQAIARVKFGSLAGAAGLAMLALAAVARRKERAAAGFCTAAMGFTSIGLEMLLLLGFQAIYGYVYQQLAIVIAGFMAGMALGSWLAGRGPRPAQPRHSCLRYGGILAILQILAAVSGLALCGLFEMLGQVRSPLLFPVLAVLCGALGGYQFQVASRIYSAGPDRSGPGALYALDLAGACLGAVLFSLYLIPVFGFLKTALLMAVVNAAPAAAALSLPRRPPL